MNLILIFLVSVFVSMITTFILLQVREHFAYRRLRREMLARLERVMGKNEG